jgi:uncharacterized membrane protein
MVQSHVQDSWTRDADRISEPFYSLQWIGGVASPLFLFLAGVASAMSAASKARRLGDRDAGAREARRRGWEVFLLGLIFRVQAQILGFGPLRNLLKVDMLNVMGLSMVFGSLIWQAIPNRKARACVLGGVAVAITLVTPLIRAANGLAVLPDPLEAYLRPAGGLAAFPIFPWSGFLIAGVLVGDLIDATRESRRRQNLLHGLLVVAGAGGIAVGWLASRQPALYPTANFWHDSPTIFAIRLGVATLLVPMAWAWEKGISYSLAPSAGPLATLGRSSLFVYWIHVEMVYGVIAEPLKRALPLWQSLAGAALLCVLLYGIVLVKNRLMRGVELPRPLRILGAVLR